jgi:hypothetical protein
MKDAVLVAGEEKEKILQRLQHARDEYLLRSPKLK